MKTTIKPTSVEDKTQVSTGKPYWIVHAEDGQKYSAFEDHKDVADKCREMIGNSVDVEVTVKGNYKNLKQFYGVSAEKVGDSSPAPSKTEQTSSVSMGYNHKTAAMLTAYAKDIVVAARMKNDESWDDKDLRKVMNVAKDVILDTYNGFLKSL